jgi:hypothetical protein
VRSFGGGVRCGDARAPGRFARGRVSWGTHSASTYRRIGARTDRSRQQATSTCRRVQRVIHKACLRFGMRSWASRGHAGLRGGVSAELADDDRTWCRAIPTPRRTPWTQRACETDRRDSRTSEADTCSVLPEPDHLDPRPQPVHPPAAVTVPTRAGAHGVPAPAGTADIIRATVTWCRPTGTGVGRRELWIVGVVLPDIR